MLETPALWVALAAMLPLMAVMAWSDLKVLKIPNWLVLAVLAVFLVCGLWGLPLETFGWRLAQGAIVLVIGFLIFAAGGIGGGDAKMAAALAPFVVPVEVLPFLALYAVMTLFLMAILRIVQHFARHETTGWMAVDQLHKPPRERVFPMGLIFAMTVVLYMSVHVVQSLI
ncbi:MAG: prepilin peptidase [Pseudomonadota bacterium]